MEAILTIISFILTIIGLKMNKIITFIKLFLSFELTYLIIKKINPEIGNINFSSIDSIFSMIFNKQIILLLFFTFFIYEMFYWIMPILLDKIIKSKSMPFFDKKIKTIDTKIQQDGINLIRNFYKQIFQLRLANPNSMKTELTFTNYKNSLFNSLFIIIQLFICILLEKFKMYLLIIAIALILIISICIITSPIMKYISTYIFSFYTNELNSDNQSIS